MRGADQGRRHERLEQQGRERLGLCRAPRAALDAAVAKGGNVVFDCGGPATITLTQQVEIPKSSTTTIDGGKQITIDGGGKTRLFHYDSGNFRANTNVVTFQHITLKNGKSSGTVLPSNPPPCSQGFDLDGSGAAIFVRDAILHVIDVTFEGNASATPGPDVAGGGIYGLGSLGVFIVGSTFRNNSGSNGGAVGSLNTDLTCSSTISSTVTRRSAPTRTASTR